jgi:protein required for attachment to host cells
MKKYIVAVIDGTQARFFTLEPREWLDAQSSPHLSEQDSLFNSDNKLQGQDLWANTKTGRNRGASSQAHSYDDHRQNHIVEYERRFAQQIINRIVNLTESYQPQQILLVAEPQILGLMRETLTSVLPKNLKINVLAKDLCHLSSHQLYEYLVKKEILPTF